MAEISWLTVIPLEFCNIELHASQQTAVQDLVEFTKDATLELYLEL